MEANPYQAPNSNVSTTNSPVNNYLKKALLGCLLFVTPVTIELTAVISTWYANTYIQIDPSHDTSITYIIIAPSPLAPLIIGGLGLLIIMHVFYNKNYVPIWFRYSVFIISILWIFISAPYGIAITLIMTIQFVIMSKRLARLRST